MLSLSLLFLLTGGSVYLIFNRTAFFWSLIPWIRDSLPPPLSYAEGLPYLLVCHGADFFWALSLPLAVEAVLDLRGRRVFLLMLCFFAGAVPELLQGVGIISGTFDFADLAAFFIGTLLSTMPVYLVEKRHLKNKKHNDE